jgi:NADH:ubiquinone oxidoreductase subunit K
MTSNAAYALVGTLIFAVGVTSVFFRRGYLSAVLSLCFAALGPLVAISGFAASGSGQTPAYGEVVGLVIVCIVATYLLSGVAIALVSWRHERVNVLDDFDEVSV